MSFDDALEQVVQQNEQANKSALGRSAVIAHNSNPGQQGENNQKARKQGMPTALATPANGPVNMEDMNSLIDDFHKLKGKTADHMSNPDFAKVAKDDHEPLSKFEDIFSGFKDRVTGLLETAESTVTGIAGAVGGAATGLATLGLTMGDVEAAKAVQEGVSDAMTYKPKTEAGQRFTKALSSILSVPAEVGKEAVDLPLESWKVGPVGKYLTEMAGEFGAYGMLDFAVRGTSAHVKNIVDSAKESKLRTRDPEAFRKFTDDASEGHPPVQMPVEKVDELLASKRMKPGDFFDNPTEYYENKFEGDGGKVDIPVSDLAANAEHITPDTLKDVSMEGVPSENEMEAAKKEGESSQKQGATGETPSETGTDQAKGEKVEPGATSGGEKKATGGKTTGAQNALTHLQKAGGVNFSDDYNIREIKQYADGKRLHKKTGMKPDEAAAMLNDEGFVSPDGQPWTADKLAETMKGGGLRNVFTPENQDVMLERKIRSQEYEYYENKIAGEVEDAEYARELLAKNQDDIKRGVLEEIAEEGYPASEEVLKELDDYFQSVTQSPKGEFPQGEIPGAGIKDTFNLAPSEGEVGKLPEESLTKTAGLFGDERGSVDIKPVVDALTPGLEAGKDIKQGVQSLLLPTAKSAEHLTAAEQLGAKLGKMHRNQEVAATALRADELAFEKMGIRDEKMPLTENPGMKFMSDMSQGREIKGKLKAIASKISNLFEDRSAQLEAAGVPLESVRENYFPGMWKTESRKAFNRAIGGFMERAKAEGRTLPEDLAEWTAEDKAAIAERTKQLMDSGKGSEKDGLQYLTRTPFKGKESFRKGKVFDDVMTAVDFGLEPVSTNPVEIAKLKLAEMDRSIMANDALKDWRASGDEKFLRVGQKVPEGWVKVDDKYGTVYGPSDMGGEGVYVGRPILGHRIVKEPVADILNNYLSSSLYNNQYFGTLYKGYMGAANLLNQSQLGVGSAFHAGFTEAEVVISGGANVLKDIYGVLRGNRTVKQLAKTAGDTVTAFYKTPMQGDKVLKEWRNPESSMDPRIQQIAKAAEIAGGGFKLEQGLRTEQTAKMVQDWYGDKKVKAAMRAPVSAIELMAKPIMDYLVPRQKAGVFGHLAWRIIEQNPGKALEALAPELRQAWNRVDARLGQVRYDRLFLNNSAKNAVQGLVRAPGWSGGTIAEIGGSLKDTVSFLKEWKKTGKAPKDLPDRVAYTMSLMATVTAANGLMTYAFTGDTPNGTDFWAFRTGGTDEYGRPERFVLPTYQKDIYAYLQDPGKVLLAKSHPIISIMADLIRNKDYYGVTIANEDDNFILRQIERGTYALKQFVPFWIRGAQKEAERGGGFMETLKTSPQKLLAPQVGIMPATSAYTLSDTEKLLNKFLGEQIPQGGRTQEAADKSKAKREIINARRKEANLSPEQQEAYDNMTDKQRRDIEKDAQMTPIQASFKKLQDPTLMKSIKVWAKATDEERDDLRDIYNHRIDTYMKNKDVPAEEKDKLNELLEKAEERKL